RSRRPHGHVGRDRGLVGKKGASDGDVTRAARTLRRTRPFGLTTGASGVYRHSAESRPRARGGRLMHTLVRAQGLSEPISHYSDAVVAGRTVYVSGQGAFDARGRLVGANDVVAQTRQVLENLTPALGAAGAARDDVVKVTVYLANRDDRPRVNEVRREGFRDNKTASNLRRINSIGTTRA